MGPATSAAAAPRVASLLDLDAELGEFLSADAVAAARQELVVRVLQLPAGPWSVERLAGTGPGHLGLLLVGGVMAHELLAEDIESMELLGPGDVLRPWQALGTAGVLLVRERWSVLADARLAVLDRELAVKLARYPEIYSVIVERLANRSQRLTVTQAISQLNRVDRRLLALFWHLAERWGRVTADGVLLPLVLSHRTLAQLVGARRPTVSTAVAELVRAGDVVRTDAGTWLLTGDPVGAPDSSSARLVPPRRQLLPVAQ